MKTFLEADLWGIVLKVSLSLVFLGTAVFTHICLSTYRNIAFLKKSWEWEKFWEGISKLMIILLSTFLICVTGCYLPVFISVLGVPLDKTFVDYISLTSILLVILKPTLAYSKENISDLSSIIEGLPGELSKEISRKNQNVKASSLSIKKRKPSGRNGKESAGRQTSRNL